MIFEKIYCEIDRNSSDLIFAASLRDNFFMIAMMNRDRTVTTSKILLMKNYLSTFRKLVVLKVFLYGI